MNLQQNTFAKEHNTVAKIPKSCCDEILIKNARDLAAPNVYLQVR